MKVTSGIKKGTSLFVPDDLSVRPTTDKVKQAIFSMIQFEDHGEKCLDLFAGSGAMGIEAVSRWQMKCDFVDMNTKSVQQNIKKCDFEAYATVNKCDFKSFLNKSLGGYSLVFLDPPYHKGFIEEATEILCCRNLLCDGCIMIFESDYDEDFRLDERISIIKQREYGRVKIKIGVFRLL